tara:strand:- start:44 stop:277 length:234 start_codon:yes stop_codon:yes gene_type:complete
MKLRIRKNTPEDNEYIQMLIKEGERIYGSSDAEGHLVLDYVQTRLEAEGKRIKIPLVPGPLVGYKMVNINFNKKGGA